MKVQVYNLAGEVVKDIKLSDYVFDVPFNEAVVHQAMVRQRADARQGTVGTKTRAEVSGTTKKLYAQKHTGFARAGSRRSPLRRGGGVAFAPKSRSFRQAMPKKMRRLALRCLLSDKARGKELKVLESLELDAPKTKEMARILATLGVDHSALIVTKETAENVVKSARNIPRVKILPTALLNVVDLLSCKTLLMTEDAIREAEEMWGKKKSNRAS